MARLRVGLTGGIASGKSLVAAELAARGAVVIDADVLAREVVEPGTDGLAAVVERFGEGVVLAVSGRGQDTEAVVVFEDEGEKRLLLAYAPLKRVG